MSEGLWKWVSVMVVACACAAFATPAFAWDFSCSPKDVTTIGRSTPNVLMMLDRSGSMHNEGYVDGTCNVCERNGRRIEVADPADCPNGLPSYDQSKTLYYSYWNSGYRHSTNFTGLPTDGKGIVEISVRLRGDFDRNNEYAILRIDGDTIGTIDDGNESSCSYSDWDTFVIPAQHVQDGGIHVEIQTSSHVSSDCDRNSVDIRVRRQMQYLGTITDREACGRFDKWEQALKAIDAVTEEAQSTSPEQIHFGLGLFYGETTATIAEECGPSMHGEIMKALEDTRPGGNTPTARAIWRAKRSDCVTGASNEEPVPTATILINDGQPTRDFYGGSSDWWSYNDALVQACSHREVAPLFIVGLGAGTDEDFNDILAAAGGTGTCWKNGNEIDPCDNQGAWGDDDDDWDDHRDSCEGSIQADSHDALLQALSEITASLACTFPIDFTGSGVSEVPEDTTNEYEYMYVEVYEPGSGTYNRVWHQDSSSASPAGEGWTFSSDQRRFVTFSDHYCENVQKYEYSEVATQLACLCQEETGTVCDVPNHEELGVCPQGTWQCTEGVDWCQPDPSCCEAGVPCVIPGLEGPCKYGQIVCDTPEGTCTQTVFPEEEICDNIDNDCDTEVDEGLSGGTCINPDAEGRCRNGIEECSDGVLSCIPSDAMPELCNGIDDDCDGAIDNMRESWEDPRFAEHRSDLGASGEAAACNFMDICMCPNGPAEIEGSDFASYLDAWTPVCTCGSNLAPAESSAALSTDAPGSESEPVVVVNSCATARGDASPLLLLLFGVLVRVRRRR